MKQLGPRGWEVRAAVVKALRQNERAKYIQMFKRSILLCPKLAMDSQWKDIRPLIRHTEGYAVLPEEYCKIAFRDLMERLRAGRPVVRRRNLGPKPIMLTRSKERALLRQVRVINTPRRVLKAQRPVQPARVPSPVKPANQTATPSTTKAKRDGRNNAQQKTDNKAKVRSETKKKRKAKLA
jgi:hypothetical protein